jgi:hypothetical protein
MHSSSSTKCWLYCYIILLLAFTAPAHAFYYAKGGTIYFENDLSAYGGGIGTRYTIGSNTAIDFSWYAAHATQELRGLYISPRTAFLYYLTPPIVGVYGGVASSWTYTRRRDGSRYSGMQLEAVAGFELGCFFPLRGFIEVCRIFPTFSIAGYRCHTSHTPFTTLSMGIGF